MKSLIGILFLLLCGYHVKSQSGKIEFQIDGAPKWRFINKALEPVDVRDNLFIGRGAGNNALSPYGNIAIGDSALHKNQGGFNIAIGRMALQENSTGYHNIAIGLSVLSSNESGQYNIGVGNQALGLNRNGYYNVAMGHSALGRNIVGSHNIGIGRSALGSQNHSGDYNVAIGAFSLEKNLNGNHNVAIGTRALRASTRKGHQVAIGDSALMNSGDIFTGFEPFYNTAVGSAALMSSDTGRHNTALGYHAGRNAIGSGNVYIGHRAGESGLGNNKLYISNRDTHGPLIYGDFKNNYVGISDRLAVGLNAPAQPLHVRKFGSQNQQTILALLEDYTSDRPTLLFSEGGSTVLNGMSIEYNGSGAGGTNKMHINALGGLPVMTFMSGGNIGIGTDTPDAKFEVAEGEVRLPSGETFPTHFNFPDGKNYIRGDTRFDHEVEINGLVNFDGTAHFRTGSDVTPSGGGYLTVGQTNGHNIGIDNNEIMGRYNGGISSIALQADGGDLLIHTNASETERVAIKDNGRLGVGISNPAYKLDVRTLNSGGYVAQIRNTSPNINGDGLRIELTSISHIGSNFVGFFDNGSTAQGRIEGLSGSGVVYLSNSDARLKENIRPMTNGLSLIRQLKPSIYEWKANGHSDIGFIAQELQNVLPNAVGGRPDGDVGAEPMAVDYGRITPVLTAAIQELLDKVERLEEEVKMLKSKL